LIEMIFEAQVRRSMVSLLALLGRDVTWLKSSCE